MFLKSLFVIVVFIAIVVISEKLHRGKRQGGKKAGGNTPAATGKAQPAATGKAQPAASSAQPSGQDLTTETFFEESVILKEGDKRIEVNAYRADDYCGRKLRDVKNKPHYMLALTDSVKRNNAFTAAAKFLDGSSQCIWINGRVNQDATTKTLDVTGKHGHTMYIWLKDDSKIISMNEEVTARSEIAPDEESNDTYTGPFMRISQSIYSWIKTLTNGTTCSFMAGNCEPRKCEITTPPCSTVAEQTCTIKKQPVCKDIGLKSDNTAHCSASCDECSIIQPSCVVIPIPCNVSEDRRCQVIQPNCTQITPECTVELPECTTYHPPCKVSHKPSEKDCIFGHDCYTSALDPWADCIPIEGHPQGRSAGDPPKPIKPCLPGDKNCSNFEEVCRIPEVCLSPRLCRPPVIHCPTPEAFCPPPRITCPPPEIYCDQPQIQCQEPMVICPVPRVECTQPILNCSAPSINCPTIATMCENPELDCPPVVIDCPDPIVNCTGMTVCHPDLPPIDKCIPRDCRSCECTKIMKGNNGEMMWVHTSCEDKCLVACE